MPRYNQPPMQYDGELWKPIPGWPKYEISNYGRVKSHHADRPRMRRQSRHKEGYMLVILCGDSRHQCFHVHRLVAQAFIPNPDSLPVVNHLDSNPSNPRADNLEWTTQKLNLAHARNFRGNWLIGKGRPGRKVKRIDPETGEERLFDSLLAALSDINEQIVAKGGIPISAGSTGNINRAIDRDKISYGYRWRSQ